MLLKSGQKTKQKH